MPKQKGLLGTVCSSVATGQVDFEGQSGSVRRAPTVSLFALMLDASITHPACGLHSPCVYIGTQKDFAIVDIQAALRMRLCHSLNYCEQAIG